MSSKLIVDWRPCLITFILVLISFVCTRAQCDNCGICYDANGANPSSCSPACIFPQCLCWWPQDTIVIDNSGAVVSIATDTRAGDFSVLSGFAANATYRFEVSNPNYWLTVYNNWVGGPSYSIAFGQSPVEATPPEIANGLMSLHINTDAGCGVTGVQSQFWVTATVQLVDSCDLDYILPAVDNCPCVTNPLQTDSDGDGIGDLCELSYDKVGIGVADPLSKLHIRGGQIYVEDTIGAMIMMAPDSTCWRLSVDTLGNLVTVQVDCF